ncbi:hypothetical protein LMH87_012300 [Akanthomyces muscarius]|uniref:Uncharacterized protein n=1 Tax=Akanthomyces muscarius TaxID=2231603 RepID=A0A9W8UM06_AKAMU|nr:hypothetical protein LMH87_012300 [Akanthomyces muscarius]KAJ4151610.1 hypothetical protein LMH87_012300 [Akanthomyces muscarius]
MARASPRLVFPARFCVVKPLSRLRNSLGEGYTVRSAGAFAAAPVKATARFPGPAHFNQSQSSLNSSSIYNLKTWTCTSYFIVNNIFNARHAIDPHGDALIRGVHSHNFETAFIKRIC